MPSHSWVAGQSCLAGHLETLPLLVVTAAQVGSAVLPQWTPTAAEGVQQREPFALQLPLCAHNGLFAPRLDVSIADISDMRLR